MSLYHRVHFQKFYSKFGKRTCQDISVQEKNTWTEKNFQITSAGSSCDIPHPTTITHGHFKSSEQNTEAIIDIIHS